MRGGRPGNCRDRPPNLKLGRCLFGSAPPRSGGRRQKRAYNTSMPACRVPVQMQAGAPAVLCEHTMTYGGWTCSSPAHGQTSVLNVCIAETENPPESGGLRYRGFESPRKSRGELAYFGSSSETIDFSSLSSLTVASILPRLNSFTVTSWTISSLLPLLRIGKELIRPFSTP